MNVDKSIFQWDSYSDQPSTLDRSVKGRLRRRSIGSVCRKLCAALLLPWPVLKTLIGKKTTGPYTNEDCIGLCINPERPFEDKKVMSPSEIAELLKELDLRRIAVRIPLADADNIQEYVDFVRHFPGYRILGVIVQDRSTIEDVKTLEASLERVFSAMSGLVDCYQVGNAVNRLKWGFVTIEEWFRFFEIAWNLRNRQFPDTRLLGGAVIDFELLDHCRSLRNGFSFKYDGYASLLYVDRRGAPENRQMGFNLVNKIHLLCRMMEHGEKVDHSNRGLWITEVNWPLAGTGRYAPSQDDTRVGEREQVCYLVRYYLLALGTGAVAACYWHQLIAPGYGLIDNRAGVLRKRPAFFGFQTLCRLFNGARIENFSRPDELGYYRLRARKNGVEILALWQCGRETAITMPPDKSAVDIEGRTMSVRAGESVTIDDAVTYLVDGEFESSRPYR